MAKAKRSKASWNASSVRALRRHMNLSQEELAAQLGTRQQTVSEWETGRYRPRGASVTLLAIIAERAEFEYGEGAERRERRKEERA
jgi:DNA-binding transcriptional regulator YiaG